MSAASSPCSASDGLRKPHVSSRSSWRRQADLACALLGRLVRGAFGIRRNEGDPTSPATGESVLEGARNQSRLALLRTSVECSRPSRFATRVSFPCSLHFAVPRIDLSSETFVTSLNQVWKDPRTCYDRTSSILQRPREFGDQAALLLNGFFQIEQSRGNQWPVSTSPSSTAKP